MGFVAGGSSTAVTGFGEPSLARFGEGDGDSLSLARFGEGEGDSFGFSLAADSFRFSLGAARGGDFIGAGEASSSELADGLLAFGLGFGAEACEGERESAEPERERPPAGFSESPFLSLSGEVIPDRFLS
jgi:hypothetical protein